MIKLRFDLMDGMVKIKDIESLNQSIISISKELINEGFDHKDIEKYINEKVNQCLASQTVIIIFNH